MPSPTELPTTWGEAWTRWIVPTEIGILLKSVDPFWVVVTTGTVPADEQYEEHEAKMYWCGGYWGFDLMTETILYSYDQARRVAEDLDAFPLNIGDLFREDSMQLAAMYDDYPNHRGQLRTKASQKTFAELYKRGLRNWIKESASG